MATNSENIISQINSNVFFKEFTFCRNDFKDLNSNQKLEFADNVVWLDDVFWIYQIKEKENSLSTDKKWFENKVLNKAVKQIKSTITYFSTYPEIEIENEKGHKLDITKAKKIEIKKIIIYSVNLDFPEELRNIKFYNSKHVGLIHLFHYEDYYWICKYLITPAEVNEYLSFRERLFLFNSEACNNLPEQYFLGHFFETPDANHFNIKYINNLKEYNIGNDDFDISKLVENFNQKMILSNSKTEYYPIIKEFAKLNRTELIEFKRLLSVSIEKTKEEDFIKPYRIYFPRTDCAIIFIPWANQHSKKWSNALHNLTMTHKYSSKASKAIGVVIFRNENDFEYFEMYWQYVEQNWEYDEEVEKHLLECEKLEIFRTSKVKYVGNRYKQ